MTTDAANPAARPLAGRTVVVTRERPGELGRLLVDAGADLVHLPLIAVAPPADGGAALDAALAESYRDVHNHLASGASNLCSDDAGKILRPIPDANLSQITAEPDPEDA